jgi:GcrA cell cycle regulator
VNNENPWSDDEQAKLRELWALDMSTAEIGRQMGRGKNSVVGKAHRLGLARPSPIIRDGQPVAPRPARRVTGPTLPLFEAPLPPVVTRSEWDMLGAVVPALAPVIAQPIAPSPRLRQPRECCWPIGEPGTKSFRYCDAEFSEPGRSYCAEHHAIAWVQPKPRPTAPTANSYVPKWGSLGLRSFRSVAGE